MTTPPPGSATLTSAFEELLDSGTRFTRDILELLQRDPSRLIGDMRQGVQNVTRMRGQLDGCGCEIPTPCWMPERLPKVSSHACPGATVKVRVTVTNCGIETRQIILVAVGTGSGGVTIEPATVTVGPFASGKLTASLSVPEESKADELDLQLWVRGCRDHVLPWAVGVSERGCSCTHEVDVEDCPDLVHHWYDHFYCEHGCRRDRSPISHG